VSRRVVWAPGKEKETMGCGIFKGPGGETMILCSRGRRTPRCQIDGCREAGEHLCDFPLSGAKEGKTCDRRLCAKHRRQQPIRRLPEVTEARLSHFAPESAVQYGDRALGKFTREDTVDFCPTHDEFAREAST